MKSFICVLEYLLMMCCATMYQVLMFNDIRLTVGEIALLSIAFFSFKALNKVSDALSGILGFFVLIISFIKCFRDSVVGDENGNK